MRDPHLETPETRETGDPIFSVTLEFASLRDVKPLEDEIAKLMPKNGSSPLRKIVTGHRHHGHHRMEKHQLHFRLQVMKIEITKANFGRLIKN